MDARSAKNILMILLVLSVVSNYTLAQITRTVTILGAGTIVIPEPTYTLKVYEQGTTDLCASIDWGTLNPGNITNHHITVKNTGTGNFILLNMTFVMDPVAVGVISWNIEGEGLAAGTSRDATLTLTVASNAPAGTFTCTIYIKGEA